MVNVTINANVEGIFSIVYLVLYDMFHILIYDNRYSETGYQQ